MKFLFVHQNFPGQYLHLIRHLLAQGGHEIVFISEPNQNTIAGVRRVNYQLQPGAVDAVHPNARDWHIAARRGEQVAGIGQNVKALGFTPDIIIGHHGWGELLNLVDVYPGVPMLGYFEFYYSSTGQDVGYDPEFPTPVDQLARVRAMNTVNHLALALGQHGQTPTRWQRTRYPAWAQHSIRLLREGARLDVCMPDPVIRATPLTLKGFTVQPADRLVTYVVRNLEPYRGYHTMMRALPHLLRRRADIKVVMVGGDDVSYGARLPSGSWRDRLQQELAGKYDASRVLMPGQVEYDTYLSLLRRSDVHVYLTYPFVPSWSLREAMACGCAIVGADVEPVREFIADGKTGLIAPGLDPQRLADRVLELLEDDHLRARVGRGARRFAEQHLDMTSHITAFEGLIGDITGRGTLAG